MVIDEAADVEERGRENLPVEDRLDPAGLLDDHLTAGVPGRADDEHGAMERADAAMYDAKSSERSRKPRLGLMNVLTRTTRMP